MPVVTIKGKVRKSGASANALREKVRETTEDLLCAADRVLVVYEGSGAQIYYEPASSKPRH